ncbi:MAG: hypothetical protein HY240_10550 [Actinobacteria bacterium]|nr:hypothetical protein [Actinomycetota bacterium]
MSRRILILASVAAVVAAACGALPQPEPNFGKGVQFLPQVADWQDNVGIGTAMAVAKDGVPYVSYFGFNKQLQQGQIALPRPVGGPYLPGVLLADYRDGLWNRGAVAMPSDPPTGVSVPFGPQTVAGLKTLTPENVNGTDVALDASGGAHVVWTGNDGVWYASAASTSTAEQVYDYGYSIQTAGPIGSPSIALDAEGNPWVAYGLITSSHEVRVATKKGNGWDTQTIATAPLCNRCDGPGPTAISVTKDGAVVVYVDQADQALMAAVHQRGKRWSSTQVERGVSGAGLALASDSSGNLYATYEAGTGQIHLATYSGGAWSVVTVGSSGAPEGVPQHTGVAVDDAGKVYVTWVGSAGVELVSGEGGSFSPVPIGNTGLGTFPSVGVAPDGSKVFLAWYAPADQDLDFGTYGQAGATKLAQPSPAPFNTGAPASSGPPTQCPKGALQIAAPAGAGVNGFSTNALTASAGAGIQICFDNQDVGVPHNVEISAKVGDTSGSVFAPAGNAVVTGPGQAVYGVGKLKPGSYFFYCFIHPTTMTGTLTVK